MRLFFADIHLSPDRPDSARHFLSILSDAALSGATTSACENPTAVLLSDEIAAEAQQPELPEAKQPELREVYLLGDIFDAWIGDDENNDMATAVKGAILRLSQAGVAVHIQRGNRDFLLGPRFCAETGCKLLPDVHPVHSGKTRFLLTHGDLFCADEAYLRWRAVVQSPGFAFAARLLPLFVRRKLASVMRGQSRKHRQTAKPSLPRMADALRKNNCQVLIHGHTHIVESEKWQQDGQTFRRQSLPDWESGAGGFLQLKDDGSLWLHS